MQHSTLEHVFRAADNSHGVGAALRLLHVLRVVSRLIALVGRSAAGAAGLTGGLDFRFQQDCEAMGSLLSLSRRYRLPTSVHRLRVFPWPHQTLGSPHLERGKVTCTAGRVVCKLTQTLDYLGQSRRCRCGRSCSHDPLTTVRITTSRRPQVRNLRVSARLTTTSRTSSTTPCLRNASGSTTNLRPTRMTTFPLPSDTPGAPDLSGLVSCSKHR